MRLTVSERDHSRQVMAPDAERTVDERTEATLRVEVEEVDAAGGIQRARLRLERYEHQRGTAAPTSASLTLAVARPAAGARLRVQEPLPGQLGAFAAQVLGWLDGDLDAALRLPLDAADGDTWQPSPAALARAFLAGGDDVEVGPAEDGLVLTLAPGPTEALIRASGEGPLPLRTIPGARSVQLSGEPHSRLGLRAEWTRARSLIHQGRLEARFQLQATGVNRLPDGKELALRVELERRLQLTVEPAPE